MSAPAEGEVTFSATDLLGIDDIADPYPAYQRMLEDGPVVAPDGLFALFPTYNECFQVITDPAASVDREKAALFQQLIAPALSEEQRAENRRGRVFLFMDPPDHTRLRRLVSKAFTRRTVEGLRPSVERLAAEMLHTAVERGRIEVVEDIAYPLPVAVISEMLGVPKGDRDTFAGWSHVLARSLDSTLSVPGGEEFRRIRSSADDFRAYVGALADERRARPREDLISALVAVEAEGDRLSNEELISTCMLLLIAGHETTVSLIGNGMLAMLRHPQTQAQLAASPELAEGFVEEVLRYDPPVQMTMRVAGAPMTVGGHDVAEGGVMVLALAAANRDPRQFSDPLRFDPTRADARHLAFGSGIHFCLGAPLARMEGQVVLPRMARRLRDPRLAAGDPQPMAYKDNIVLRGLSRLHLEFDT